MLRNAQTKWVQHARSCRTVRASAFRFSTSSPLTNKQSRNTPSTSTGSHYANPKDQMYTVRPVNYWMDKLMQGEKQKDINDKSPKTPRKLVEKTMKDSYIEIHLPFKSSKELLEEYIFVDGRIRTGKLLEDLDSLAGAIGYKHIETASDQTSSPVTIVTASVDRLDLFLPKAVENYRLSGHVTYTGYSSMEIFIKGEVVPEGNEFDSQAREDPASHCYLDANTVLATRFTMVAIDSITHKPVQVCPLVTTSPEEERLRQMAEQNKQRKKRDAETSFFKQPPTPQESLDMHTMFFEYSQYVDHQRSHDFAKLIPSESKKPLPDTCVWMSDTCKDALIVCQPQFRNVHNNIFGGFIMKKALELSYATASTFFRSKTPLVLSMDNVTFRKPVFVGSLLEMNSAVVYSPGHPHRSIQVRIVADILDIDSGKRSTTNIFYFSLTCDDPTIKVRQVLPRSYGEILLWLDGKRRRLRGMHSRQLLLEDLQRHT
ncbi:acyl-CoA hydrolase [Hesseltinella vesiculosa]|uniref:Acyl-CoA hydrolase n=1 Tax=Hesseltinella vesiculosa TaxID=101127 RepID=A0A1X2GHX6_9FUNG|nr:acyl-CoA hydrolase [Hesseltinella vesiculosa]